MLVASGFHLLLVLLVLAVPLVVVATVVAGIVLLVRSAHRRECRLTAVLEQGRGGAA